MTSLDLPPYAQSMEGRNEMSSSIEKILVPAPQLPQPPSSEETDSRLNISVVFTSVEATLIALKEAAALASRLAAWITLVVPQIVPYHVPLESPPVLRD